MKDGQRGSAGHSIPGSGENISFLGEREADDCKVTRSRAHQGLDNPCLLVSPPVQGSSKSRRAQSTDIDKHSKHTSTVQKFNTVPYKSKATIDRWRTGQRPVDLISNEK